MKYKVILTPEAIDQAEKAYRWIQKSSPQNAARWYNRLLDKIYTLEEFPTRCSIAPENDTFDVEVRQLLFGNYRILFWIDGRAVRVLHIRHGARRHLGESEE
jgi:plasmid stabilization system protein ParE